MPIAADDERSELVNLETMDSISFQLTPHVISPSVSVNYNDQGGIGASSVNQVYSNTSAEEITVEFPYYRVGLANAGGMSVEAATAAMDRHRDFVRSLTLPGTRSDGLSKGAPPLCLLTIPGHLVWKCRVRSFKYDRRIGQDGKAMELKLNITFREEWTTALSSEDILEKGYNRG